MERLEIQAKALDAADVPPGIWDTIGQDLAQAQRSGGQTKAASDIYDTLTGTMASHKDALRRDMKIAATIHDAPTPTLSSYSPANTSTSLGPSPGALAKPPTSTSASGSRRGTATGNTTKPKPSSSTSSSSAGKSAAAKGGVQGSRAPGLWGFHIVEETAADTAAEPTEEDEEEQPWLGDGDDAKRAHSAFLTFQSTLLGIAAGPGPRLGSSGRGSRKGSKTVGGGVDGSNRASPVPGQGPGQGSGPELLGLSQSNADDRRRTVTFSDNGQQVTGDIAAEGGGGESKDSKRVLSSLPSSSSPQHHHHHPISDAKEPSDSTSLPQLPAHKPPPTIRSQDNQQPSSSAYKQPQGQGLVQPNSPTYSLSPVQVNKYYTTANSNNRNRNSNSNSSNTSNTTKKSLKKSSTSSSTTGSGGFLPPKRREFNPVQTMDRDEHLPYQCRYKGKEG